VTIIIKKEILGGEKLIPNYYSITHDNFKKSGSINIKSI